jgi:hypothetical protein
MFFWYVSRPHWPRIIQNEVNRIFGEGGRFLFLMEITEKQP